MTRDEITTMRPRHVRRAAKELGVPRREVLDDGELREGVRVMLRSREAVAEGLPRSRRRGRR